MSVNVGKHSDEDYRLIVPGVRRKVLVTGVNTLTAKFLLEAGHMLPLHSHPEEQTGYLVSGNIILSIDGIKHDMKPGDSWTIGGGISHQAEILEDSVALEIFSPLKKEYL